MAARTTTEEKYWAKYYKSLEGATIIKFNGFTEAWFDAKPFPSFQVKFADGSIGDIDISCDREGNGGGFIFGLNQPQGDL